MSRWEPGGRGRLEQAALALYAERGFDNTTVAEIAERAGVTERTFFRHFADKREVLFGGAGGLQDLLVGTVASAPASLAPLDAVAAGLEAAGALFEEYRATVRQRAAIIAATPLRGRGLSGPAASLTAEVATAVFRITFDQWIEETNERTFAALVRESLDHLKAVTAGGVMRS